MAPVEWFPARPLVPALVTLLYLGAVALLLRLVRLGALTPYLLLAAIAIAVARLATLPLAAGMSGEGLHLRSLVRRRLPWASIARIEAGRGLVRVTTRAGARVHLPDPRGLPARALEGRFPSGLRA